MTHMLEFFFSTFGCMQSFLLSLFLNKNSNNADNVWYNVIALYYQASG